MSKFIVKTSTVISIPDSFRKEILDLNEEIERNSHAELIDVIDAIFCADPEDSSWEKYDGSIRVNFVKGEEEK